MGMLGEYKKAGIRIMDIYVTQTYQRYFFLRDLRKINRRIINHLVYMTAASLFGRNAPRCIADIKDIDYDRVLPLQTVYAHLWCESSVIGENGSNLVLIWFQDPEQDPLASAAEKLKTIDWEIEAEDTEYFR